MDEIVHFVVARKRRNRPMCFACQVIQGHIAAVRNHVWTWRLPCTIECWRQGQGHEV